MHEAVNAGRWATIAGHELRTQLAGPLFWVLVLLVLLVTSTLNPVAMIPSGDTAVGGVRAFVNSPHALAQTFAIGSFFAYTFFAALMAGLSIVRDDESGIAPLIHSTPLTPAEYVLGKFAGVIGALGVALAVHVLLAIGFYQAGAWGGASEVHGPFRFGHYLLPALVFAAPGIWGSAAIAFAVGERTRRPMAVYAVPTLVFVLTFLLFWNWRPPGIDPRVDRLLTVLDPTSLRWLQAHFEVDRGIAFYNTAPLPFDGTLLINRLLVLILPTLAVLASIRHLRASIGRETRRSRRRRAPAASTPPSLASFRPLRSLAMTSRRPSLFAGAWTVLRSEIAELIRQPSLYLFTAFLMMVVAEVAGTEDDAFGAPVLLTAGNLAVNTLPVVTVLVCLFLLFTVIESLYRERATGFDSIFHSSPVSNAAILFGKGLASAVVIGVLTAACGASGLLLLLLQKEGRVEVWPLVLVFGLVLAPTFLLWTAFVTAVMAIVRQRSTALAVGLAALVLTGFQFVSGSMTWATNWPLWGALRWSDFGTFPLNGGALLWNRAAAVAVAVFLFAVAFTFFPRTERDAVTTLDRLRPRRLFYGALRLAPFALMPLLIGGFLGIQVSAGFQGETAEARAKEGWRQNVVRWHGVTPPEITRINLKLDLEPSGRRMRVRGTYAVINPTGEPMRRLPFTVGPSFEKVSWTLDGAPVTADDHNGLQVLSPREPLAPGGTAHVGFAYAATYPKGFTRNGGGASTFILPAGVLLSTHRGEFLPVPGFVESPGASRNAPFMTRVEVSAPSGYTVNSVGVKTAQWGHAGRTTVVWESDHPVAALNVIAGRWDVRRKNGTAVFFHPGHPYNVDRILGTLVAARARYSEWFYPYPWKELRLSEFPDLETNATAFPTNISFSEGIGFLTGGDPRSGLAFSVTAHEAAHQWWGHLLTAGDGPGTGLLIEGMANYSALLLHESENGPAARIGFARRLEQGYLEARRVDAERPLLETEETSASGEAVLSQKGAFVMWMLHNHLGRDRMLAGLRELVGRHVRSREPAAPQDLIAVLRKQAEDPAAYDRFVDQWLAGAVLPEYELSGATVERTADGWRASATITNVGTGTARVEVAALRGERFGEGFAEKRTALWLAPGRPGTLTWTLGFPPERIVVDPDALVLQLNRDRAVAELEDRPRT
ncbi:MAG TPA: ABC transporter permease subunit [Thermoanaerobaculia bacterium]|nr:ABC transporter permease subunit [Thermoanaerobaculia bacterium]